MIRRVLQIARVAASLARSLLFNHTPFDRWTVKCSRCGLCLEPRRALYGCAFAGSELDDPLDDLPRCPFGPYRGGWSP